jgi:WD40 repeat protein
MTTDDAAPILVFAFANDRQADGAYLRNLGQEADQLRTVLKRAKAAGLCEFEILVSATSTSILNLFQEAEYRGRIALFHYAGHADDYHLLLESATGGRVEVDARALAGYLRGQNTLQLVFLNGCSTRLQVDSLLDAGISAVIATARKIPDRLACEFAVQFYTALANGDTIQTAFGRAQDAVQFTAGEQLREIRPSNSPDDHSTRGLPWALYGRPGAELALQWDLPQAAHNPLYGLPPLPKLDLPPQPFRDLSWFRRVDAPIFFGRGRQIRDLYTQVINPRTAPLILFYGQSGVGKSSLLDAGLLPRLEANCRVVYARRDQTKGLLGTLTAALTSSTLGESRDLADTWLAGEQTGQQPVVLILDQVEELYTRPNPQLPDELVHFLTALVHLFADRAKRPQGKLILSFRKEWLAEFEKRLLEYELPCTKVFLERLDERGIIEAVTGVAETPALRTHYGLTIEEGLPERIAGDLLEDRNAAVAPMLQILLTRMWAQAKAQSEHRPLFSHTLYDELRVKGLLLRDFLEQQLTALSRQQAEAVNSGLALDLLALHTTKLGTADQHTLAELRAIYAHRTEMLSDLLRSFQNLYLLADPAANQATSESTVRLAHDTLAPHVRARFDESDLPGQRARRILESRAVEWDDPAEEEAATPLDRQDLAVVEAGIVGMRVWTPTEQRLIDASRAERARWERRERLLRWIGALALLVIVVTASYAWWQRGQAVQDRATAQQAQIKAQNSEMIAQAEAQNAVAAQGTAEARRQEAQTAQAAAERESAINLANALNAQSLLQSSINAECSLNLALTAYDQAVTIADFPLYPFEDRVRAALHATHVRQTLLAHTTAVEDLDVSPDGSQIASVSSDGVVHLWEAKSGAEIATLHTAEQTGFSVAWHPEGKQLAVGARMIELWDVVALTRVLTFTGHSGVVRALDWSPDGERLVSGADDKSVRIWDMTSGTVLRTLTQHREIIRSIAWRPGHEEFSVSDFENSVILWDAKSSEVFTSVRALNGSAQGIAWSPDGERLALALMDGTIQIWGATVWESRQPGEEITLEGHTHAAMDVVWNAAGTRLLSVAQDNTVRLWDTTTNKQVALFTGHTDIINSVQWLPSAPDFVSAGGDGTVRLWRLGVDASTQSAPFPLQYPWGLDTVWSADGQWLASSFSAVTGNDLYLWNPTTGESRAILDTHRATITRIAWSPDDKQIATISGDYTAHIYDVATGAQVTQFTGHTRELLGLVWSPDGRQVATGGNDLLVYVWDAKTGQSTTQHFQGGIVNDVDWHPQQPLLASAGSNDRVDIWHAADGTTVYQLEGHNAAVASVAWEPAGKLLASGGSDGLILIWDATTGQQVRALTGHTGTVWDLDWYENQLASASADETVRVWDVATGAILATLTGHQGTVRAANWRPDGQAIATIGLVDQQILIYPLDFATILPVARQQAEQGSSPEERARCLAES